MTIQPDDSEAPACAQLVAVELAKIAAAIAELAAARGVAFTYTPASVAATKTRGA